MPYRCACCGRPLPGATGEVCMWCAACMVHVKDDGPLMDRSFYAQHGEICPFDPMGMYQGSAKR